MSKFKIIFIVLLVVGVAGTGGYFAALQYAQTKAVVQERQDEKTAKERAESEAREQKEIADSEARWKARAEADRKAGRAENPDQVLRGLTADMKIDHMEDGSMRYAYDPPTEDGIYIEPFIVQNGAGVQLYITVRHLGTNPVGFQGIVLKTSKKDAFRIAPAVPVEKYDRAGGIVELFTQPADAHAIHALREVAAGLSGGIRMAGMDGSNDDRNLTGTEAARIKDMMDLYDILSGRKKSIDAQDADEPAEMPVSIEPEQQESPSKPAGQIGQVEKFGDIEGEVIPLD